MKTLKSLLPRIERKPALLAGLLVFFALLLYSAAPVFAMEGTGGGGWKDWFWKIVNVAILVAVLLKFMTKPAKEYFRKRTELIEKSLAEAKEAKELAMKALEEVESKLRLKDQEIERIIASAKQSGQAEHDSLIEQGEQMGEKIRQQAKTNIEMELQNAKAALRAEAAGLAIKLAEKRLKEQLSEEEQLRLLEESIKRLEG